MGSPWTGRPGDPTPEPLRHALVPCGERQRRCTRCDGYWWLDELPREDALCRVAVVQRLAEMEASVRAAKDRADAAEARCDAIEERVATADMPWRLPGCQCPADAGRADRCDSRWTRCNARLRYQRAMKVHPVSPAPTGADAGRDPGSKDPR